MPIDATARRRRREEGGGRPHKVTVRLTDAEFERIRARAIGVGLTPASYLAEVGQAAKVSEASGPGDGPAVPASGVAGDAARLLVEKGRAFGVLERRALAAELFGVRRLLIGVGTNLNQLARVANSTGEVPTQVGVAAGAVQRYLVRLEAVVSALDPRIRL